MALVLDTGPLYAALDRSDADHQRSRSLIENAGETLIIPGPVLVEVDYWVHTRMHLGVMLALLDDIRSGAYVAENAQEADYQRIRELCDRYASSDIGFVDAAILAIVERLHEPKLATLDHRHFTVLRPRHVAHLQLLPE